MRYAYTILMGRHGKAKLETDISADGKIILTLSHPLAHWVRRDFFKVTEI
jgi:hypothetical protein